MDNLGPLSRQTRDRGGPHLTLTGFRDVSVFGVRADAAVPGPVGVFVFGLQGPGDGVQTIVSALTPVFTRELYLRWRQRRVPAGAPALGAVISSSADVARLFGFLIYEPREHIYSLHVSGSNVVIGVELVGMGGMSEATCGVADVFRSALLSGAAALVIVHNHPSGRPMPSQADRTLTEELRQAGRLLRVPLLDHLIVGRRGHYSFADHGALPR